MVGRRNLLLPSLKFSLESFSGSRSRVNDSSTASSVDGQVCATGSTGELNLRLAKLCYAVRGHIYTFYECCESYRVL